jgi:hypothetical protein
VGEAQNQKLKAPEKFKIPMKAFEAAVGSSLFSVEPSVST